MHLRVTDERDTFVYATSPISFGGLNKEDLVFWMVPMAATNNITQDSLLSFAVGCIVLWLYKKLTANQPEGHLILRGTVAIGLLEKSELAAQYPAIKTAARAINRLAAKVWLEKGLLPSHGFCNIYEP